jgi:Flp pilus assembly pilin Flp
VIAIAKHARRFRSDESGSTAIEYGLIASVMGIMLIPTIGFFSGAFSNWATQLTDGFMTVMGL